MSRSKSNGLPGTGVPSPCMGCEVREPACHDRCEKYAEYRVKLKEIHDNKMQYVIQRCSRPDRNAQVKSSAYARKSARRKKYDQTI